MLSVYNLEAEELQLVEQTDLMATEKFMLRILLSSWKILCHIARSLQVSVEELTPEQIRDWLLADHQVRLTQGAEASFLKWNDNMPDLEFPDQRQDIFTDTDLTSHEKFLGRLLLSAPQVLLAMAEKYQIAIAQLSVSQIVSFVQGERNCLQWQN